MRLAFSAQTLVPSRAVYLIFMSVPPAACQVYSARCLCGDRDGTRQLPSVPWRAGGERTAGRVPSFLRNEAVRQPTIHTGRTGASSGAAKSSFVPPPEGGPVSMRHLSAWAARGRIPLLPLTSLRFLALCIGLAIAIPLALLIWWRRAPRPDFRTSTATSPLPTKPLLRMVASDSARQCAAQVPKSRRARAVDREWTTHKECSATRPNPPPRTTSLAASADPAPSGRCYWKGIVSA